MKTRNNETVMKKDKSKKSVFDAMNNFRQWDELDCESDDWIESLNEQQQNDSDQSGGSLSKAVLIVRLISSFALFLGVIFFVVWFFS